MIYGFCVAADTLGTAPRSDASADSTGRAYVYTHTHCALLGGWLCGLLVCYQKRFVRGPIYQKLVNWLRITATVLLAVWMTVAFYVSMGYAPEYSGLIKDH